jgi:NADPH:quinone reductase-like Zn-dependent oxidoreductase
MKAAVVTTLGRAPVYGDFPDPEPSEGMVVAAVAAAALKNLDRGVVSGTHYSSSRVPLPSVAGTDGVARLDDGGLVYASAVPPYGMMAAKTLIDPGNAVKLPEGIDPMIAAAVPNPALSAWISLEQRAQVQAGQWVLVLGATGVTGSLAVQLAKAVFGVGSVVAVGRNEARLEWLRAVGADDVIQSSDDLAARVGALHQARPFDVVLDYLWGTPAEQVLAALANTGLDAAFHATRFVQVGNMAGPTITLPAGILRSAGIELVGMGFGSVPAEAFTRAAADHLPRLFAMIAEGKLHLQTQQRPLSEVEQVWTHREPSGTRIVFTPQDI